jgi:hypothetical protein
MALTTEETKAVAVDIWNQLTAEPPSLISQRAFEKLSLRAYHRAVLAKNKRDEEPRPIAAE